MQRCECRFDGDSGTTSPRGLEKRRSAEGGGLTGSIGSVCGRVCGLDAPGTDLSQSALYTCSRLRWGGVGWGGED